jgi:hypothetical protein
MPTRMESGAPVAGLAFEPRSLSQLVVDAKLSALFNKHSITLSECFARGHGSLLLH